jgi:hypothetical protein
VLHLGRSDASFSPALVHMSLFSSWDGKLLCGHRWSPLARKLGGGSCHGILLFLHEVYGSSPTSWKPVEEHFSDPSDELLNFFHLQWRTHASYHTVEEEEEEEEGQTSCDYSTTLCSPPRSRAAGRGGCLHSFISRLGFPTAPISKGCTTSDAAASCEGGRASTSD